MDTLLQTIVGGLVLAGATAWAGAFYRRFGRVESKMATAEGHLARIVADNQATNETLSLHSRVLVKHRDQLRLARRRGQAQKAEIDELDTRVTDLEQTRTTGEP